MAQEKYKYEDHWFQKLNNAVTASPHISFLILSI